MTTVLLIRTTPSTQAVEQARQFLEKGGTISLVFFYQDGVLQAFDESPWQALAHRYGLKLLACQSSINDRHLSHQELQRPFDIGTLADFFYYLSQAHHSICCLIEKTPPTTLYAKESMAFMMAAINVAEPLTLIFSGDGILQLKKLTLEAQQQNHTIGYRALKLYEVGEIYAIKEDFLASELKIDDLLLEPKLLDEQQLPTLLKTQDFIFRW